MHGKTEQYKASIPLGEMYIPLQHFLDRFNVQLEELRGKTVVDIGGGVFRAFGEQVFAAIGTKVITIEPRAGNNGKQSELAPVIAAEAQQIPLQSESVDMVVSSAMMPMWLPTRTDMQQAFSEVERLLKPNGEGRFYPPMHEIFIEEYHEGTITLPEDVQHESSGTQTSYATLIGLQNLGIRNLELRKRHVGDYEVVYQKEVLIYKKPQAVRAGRDRNYLRPRYNSREPNTVKKIML